MSQDLRQRLQQAAPPPQRQFDASTVEREAGRRKRRRAGVGLGLLALLVVAGVAFGLISAGDGSGGRGIAVVSGGPTPSATPTPERSLSPGLSMTPMSGLSDGSVVTVSGSGFAARQAISIRQCPQSYDCGALQVLSSPRADTSGRFEATLTLHTVLRNTQGGTTYCGQACFLVATQAPETSNVGAQSIRFDLVPPAPGPVCHLLRLQASYDGLGATLGPVPEVLRLRLHNPSATPCWLQGYPTVQLMNGKSVLLWTNELASLKADWVELTATKDADVLLSKSACTAGTGQFATSAELVLGYSSAAEATAVDLPANSVFERCVGSGKEPENTVTVGPFQAQP